MALVAEAPRYNVDVKRDMQRLQQKGGVPLTKQVRDFLHVRKIKSGLTMDEYLTFSLYEKDRSEYDTYIGDMRARSTFLMANKLTSWDAASDKYFYAALLKAANLPNPPITAIVHKSREAADAVSLRSKEDIVGFLENCNLPIFGKPVQASHGDGSVSISKRDGKMLKTSMGEDLDINVLAEQLVSHLDDEGYIFQETLTPHHQIAKITGNRLATARILVFVGPDGPFVHGSVLRLPAGGNLVDNFRRPGNLIAGIDIETGITGEAVRGVGMDAERLQRHPDTDEPIAGQQLPDFEASKALALKAAHIYPDLRIQSWDVAFTDKGPVLLEMNPGGNFNIFQFAHGRGLFDADFRKFVEWCMNDNTSAASNPKAFGEAKKLLKLE